MNEFPWVWVLVCATTYSVGFWSGWMTHAIKVKRAILDELKNYGKVVCPNRQKAGCNCEQCTCSHGYNWDDCAVCRH